MKIIVEDKKVTIFLQCLLCREIFSLDLGSFIDCGASCPACDTDEFVIHALEIPE